MAQSLCCFLMKLEETRTTTYLALSQTPRSTLSATVVFISKRLESGKKRMFPRTTRNLFYKIAKFRTPRLGGRREIFLVSVTPEGFEEKNDIWTKPRRKDVLVFNREGWTGWVER